MFEYMPTFKLSIISFFNLFMPFLPLLSVSKKFPVNIWPINFKINNNNKKTFFLISINFVHLYFCFKFYTIIFLLS